jgi:hypothetical protein
MALAVVQHPIPRLYDSPLGQSMPRQVPVKTFVHKEVLCPTKGFFDVLGSDMHPAKIGAGINTQFCHYDTIRAAKVDCGNHNGRNDHPHARNDSGSRAGDHANFAIPLTRPRQQGPVSHILATVVTNKLWSRTR